ncbi:MAG TPA: enoyl-CoA hydratase-related protein [Acidimicrobiales bacterium]|nr:enoyl-CoA hydratase-related protein [Acidimicrobiales bacterium]
MATSEVRYEVTDRVARITIDRQERRNALSWDVVRELRAAFARAKADDEVGVVVLTGAGEKAFCAGADLEGMAAGASPTELHEGRGELAELFRDLYALGKPTIARVRGYALAGGFGLALACDLVVAADDAVFGTPEITLGLWPHMITVPLIRAMPPKRALELMLTGRRVDAAEADRIGFVTRVVPVAELDAAVDDLAAELASRSPIALRQGRDSFYAVWDQAVDASLRLLHPLLSVTASTADAAEGIAARSEGRPPRWTGR